MAKITEKEVSTVLDMWEKNSGSEIAKELGTTTGRVSYIAHAIRKAGHKLPKKGWVGETKKLIQSVLKERGLIT